jgi:hypothetical protein
MAKRILGVVLVGWLAWAGIGCGSSEGGCTSDAQCAVGVCEAGICVQCRGANDCAADQGCVDKRCVDLGEQCQGAASCNNHGVCNDSSGLIVCTCQVEYTGDRCESCAAGYHLEGSDCVENQGDDLDGDGVADDQDNCPAVANAGQVDTDDDSLGDACDEDDDNDEVLDADDCNPTDPAIGHCALFYQDLDDDTFGDPLVSTCACAPTGDYTSTSPTDCDDNDAAVQPGAAELCDGIDQNCNEIADDGFDDSDLDGQADCVDADDDGDGVDDGLDNCLAAYNPDQNDTDADGAGDACDDDDDGDGAVDAEDNCPFLDNPGQEDVDGNGVGDACDSDRDGDGVANDLDNCPDLPNADQLDFDSDGRGDACDDDDDDDGIQDASDCEPLDPAIYPGAPETCNQLDDDCDASTDEGQNAAGCSPWYLDADNDGYGSMVEPARCFCQATGQYTASAADDCNDNLPAVHPGASEVCNGVDDNCAGGIDEPWPTVGTACDGPADPDQCEDGTVRCTAQGDGTFCDDDAATPGGQELCNGADDDCDGQVDENWPTLGQPCDGADSDSCANGTTVCNAAHNGTTCINDLPNHTEICNGQDDDCDGTTDEGCDDDNDNYCDQNMTVVGSPATCTAGGGDCNDQNSAIHPNHDELCDGLDNDCDGATDEGGTWPSNSGDASDVIIGPTPIGGIGSANPVSTGDRNFWHAADLDYYSWTSPSRHGLFWICRVIHMSSAMRVRLTIGYRDGNTPAGWTATVNSGTLANNGSVYMPVSAISPYTMLAGIQPVSGISPCFALYNLECKFSNSNVW